MINYELSKIHSPDDNSWLCSSQYSKFLASKQPHYSRELINLIKVYIRLSHCVYHDLRPIFQSLVEIKGEPDMRIVHVGYGGRVSAWNPVTTSNLSVQSLALLPAGTSRYIYMPVLPKLPGNTSFTICAYTFIGSNCETRTISVSVSHRDDASLYQPIATDRLWRVRIALELFS